MTRRIVIVIAGLLLACSGACLGCDRAGTTSPSHAWAAFESEVLGGQSLSLQLPESFAGGNLHEPSILAELDEYFNRNMEPDDAKRAQDALVAWTRGGPRTELLFMAGPFDSSGRFPQVLATRQQNAYGFNSLEELLDYDQEILRETFSWTIESMTEDRAYAEIRSLTQPDAPVHHVAYAFRQPYIYIVWYFPPSGVIEGAETASPDSTYDDVFARSAESIVVESK